MWHDYGYIEDDRKTGYDLKIMWRFAKYARPYLPMLILTSFLILAGTAADLVLPYLTKVAIDRHIVVTYHQIDETKANEQTRPLLEKYADRLKATGKSGISYIHSADLRNLPSEALSAMKKSGLVGNQTWYLVDMDDGEMEKIVRKYPDKFKVFPQVAAIRSQDQDGLEEGDKRILRGDDVRDLGVMALFACVVLVLGYVFSLCHTILLEYAGQRVAHDLRQDLARHVFTQSMSFHDKSATGKLVARVTNDIQNLSEMVKSVAVTFFSDVFILVGIISMLLYLNVKLALVTFALLPPIFIASMIFRRLARDVFRQLRVKVAEINASVSETVSGIRVVQAFRRESYNKDRFAELNQENYKAGMRQIQVFALFMPIIEVLSSMALGLIIWYGGLNVLSETMTLGVVVAFIGYSRKFFQPIRDLAEKFNILQSAMASLERVFHLLDQDHSLPIAENPEKPPEGDGSIVFEKVHFGYNQGVPVLKDVSFDLEPGKTLAIVGATGAGKTSIINLLFRFYDINSGRILVDGADIRDLDPDEHRRRIGLVMQDVFIFDGTVKENIALSRNGVGMDRIEAAAKAVDAHSFIEKLPQGYDQQLGEGGKTLSVGQRQLLAFARVLVEDPNILVLDEATAFIDSESELLIEKALEKLTAGRTSIIIAHRLSTIRRADRILVLHQGRVAESGDHRELIETKGVYYRLHQLQFIGNN